ncbi:M81 family metallopeptidase [Bacillus sp. FJAT-47783]|uniref:M81 family metallopeptidase n=1 Tax=Bacillus sp. FJAT-47783 TaxID=2922712 RepID=UPI001FAB499A|nr:M81 family metallopeptidase [Bacillus sp. FJAT-47783]
MKIAIGQVMHESNTFSSVKTTVESFKEYQWIYGEEILEKNRNVKGYLGGMIDKGNELGVDLIPTFSAFCNPSGLITKQTYETLRDELITAIKYAEQLDAICLALHGSGVAEDHYDLEGDLLKALRKAVGYEIPIVVALDLHGNITKEMVKEADALLGVNYYPHTDTFDRGQEAMALAVKIVQGDTHPVMSFVKLPLIIFPSTTYRSPAKDINERCWSWEKEEDVIDCTFFHGFARADTPDTGAAVVTITNNDIHLAQKISADIANRVWGLREKFVYNYPSPEVGIDKALLIEGYPIIINETSDNPGSGAPGDGTFLLKSMIEKDVPNSCFGFIYDPIVAKIAHESGVGSTINVELGGKTDSLHGNPLFIKAYVKSLTDGKFIRTSSMSKGALINLGKSARLQIGNVDIIVCSVKSQTLDEQVFLIHGIDVTKYKLVALKSCQHFREVFQPISKEIITVDSPGISTSNASFYEYDKLPRPIYPLDPNCHFQCQ